MLSLILKTMSLSEKIKQWQEKSEKQKHFIATIGSSVFTLLIVIVWGYNFLSPAETTEQVVKNKTMSEQFSPIASVRNLFSGVSGELSNGTGALKNTAASIFGGSAHSENERVNTIESVSTSSLEADFPLSPVRIN